MSIAQAQAMRKAREDIEALKAQVDDIQGRMHGLERNLSVFVGWPQSPVVSPIQPLGPAQAYKGAWSPHADASIPPSAWDATPPAFDPDLIYNISPADIMGPPISSMKPIVSANIASPPKKRGRPPKA